MKEVADADYIDRVLRGDRDAYRYLVGRYKDLAYTLAYGILKQETEAEDAAQEGFIKAFQQLKQFNRESKFSTWLYTIVYRTALYKRKRQQRYMALPPNYDQLPDTKPGQNEQLSQAERKHYLKRAIASLPEKEAAIVTLFYLDENSIATVSEITGLTVVNVKVKLHRARKKLHLILSPVIDQL